MPYHHGKVAPKRWPIHATWATLGLLSTTLLSSCLSLPDGTPMREIRSFTVPPESIQAISEIRLRWMIREDAGEYCQQQLKRPAASATSPLPLACALWNAKTKECTVVTKPTTTHVIMGHEVHHCFSGHFHKM